MNKLYTQRLLLSSDESSRKDNEKKEKITFTISTLPIIKLIVQP